MFFGMVGLLGNLVLTACLSFIGDEYLEVGSELFLIRLPVPFICSVSEFCTCTPKT